MLCLKTNYFTFDVLLKKKKKKKDFGHDSLVGHKSTINSVLLGPRVSLMEHNCFRLGKNPDNFVGICPAAL